MRYFTNSKFEIKLIMFGQYYSKNLKYLGIYKIYSYALHTWQDGLKLLFNPITITSMSCLLIDILQVVG